MNEHIHFVERCKYCGIKINQCRCASPNKEQRQGICEACAVMKDTDKLVTSTFNFDERWHRHFINLCVENAKMSKDPSTKVGALIVGPDREVRSMGFNGFPRGVEDSTERLQDRDLKNTLIVHAELNAILAAARVGIPLKGCTLYFAAMTDGVIWGGAPCLRCGVELIQVGITRVVSVSNTHERWRSSCDDSRKILQEAGVTVENIRWQA